MTRDRETLHQGVKFRLDRVRVATRGGGSTWREVAVHPGAVVILPLLDDGRVVLIRNRRFTVDETLWELPAGTREASEPVESCALRELEEETGYRAGRLEGLLELLPSPGITDERMYVFVARDLEAREQRLDATEEIEVFPTEVDEIRRMIREGEIVDAKTVSSFLYWDAFRR